MATIKVQQEVIPMTEEYRQKEAAFMERHDALCENVSPLACDCSQCLAREMCEWLCEHDPNRC